MTDIEMNDCIENDDYFNTNEHSLQQQPQKKKLRKLVKKIKGANNSEDDENAKEFGEEDYKKGNNIVSSQDIDNNSFEKRLLIQGEEDDGFQDGKREQNIYKSKLDELSEQIALMDAEKQGKKQRKSNKNKNNRGSNEYLQFDEDEEKQIASKQEKKNQRMKKPKERVDLEKNEDMMKRLAEKFNDEEEDNDDNYKANQDEDIDEDYEMNPESNKKKTNKAKGSSSSSNSSKQNQSASIIKTNNKFFKEINTLEQTNLDNIEEQPVEEECLLEESIKFERQNNKNQKNLQGFLKQSILYKKQRGLEYENSQTKFKDTFLTQDITQSQNQTKSIAQNQEGEEKKDQADQLNSQKKGENPSSNDVLNALTLKEFGTQQSSNQSNEDSQKIVDFSNIQRQISSTSIGAGNSQDKKLQILKQSSSKIQRMLSFSQSQNFSQNSNKQSSQTHDEDLDIELLVPTVDQSQKHSSLINNTLFFNKIIRTNNQNIFASNTQTNTQGNNNNNKLMKQNSISSANSNNLVLGQSSSQSSIPEKKQLFSRNEYLKQGQKRITERKSQSINIQEVQNTFKQTGFSHLMTLKDQKSKGSNNSNQATSQENQNNENNEDAQKMKKHDLQNEDEDQNEKDSQNTENDSDFDPNQNSDDEENVEKDDNDENNDDDDENNEDKKQRQLIEAEIQYRKLLALEEGIDEKEFEKLIRLEYGLVAEVEEEEEEKENNGEDLENQNSEQDGQENDEDNDNDQNDLENQLEAYEEEGDANNRNRDEQQYNEEDGNQKRPLRRLKNIAVEILKKQQEKKEMERIRQQKQERKQQLMNNPIMKKLMNDMIEDEAELGSDNEENDDQVKNTANEDEHKEAGFAKNEDLDAELKELINNVVEFNEEDEQHATSKFLRDLARRDKEEIRKIIEGAYKGTRAKKRNLSDLLEEEGDSSEAKKLKRIQEAIRTLQDQAEENQYSDGEDDGEDDKGGNQIFDPLSGTFQTTKSKSKRNRKDEMDEEKEQIKQREANLVLKKEYLKVSGQQQFDEKKLIDSTLLNMISSKQTNTSFGKSTLQPLSNGPNKKIIPTKISDQVGVIKGNLSTNNNQMQQQQQQQQTGLNLNNLRGSNVKNSILHVKQNKNRFSQFNNSFNKESMINEFGESALDKAFQNYADHSQSIFYSKQNEDSNSKPFEKEKNNNKLTKQSSSNLSQSGSSSNNFKTTSSLNKLFKSSSVLTSGPSANSLMIFGRKKAPSQNNETK